MTIARSSPLLLLGATLTGWVALRSGYLAWLSMAVMAPPADFVPPAFDIWSPSPASDRYNEMAGLPATAAMPIVAARSQGVPAEMPFADRPAPLQMLVLSEKPAFPIGGPAAPSSENNVLLGNRLLLRRMLASRPTTHDRAGLMSTIIRPAGTPPSRPPV